MNKPGLPTVWGSFNQSPTVRVALLAVVLGFGHACTTWRTTPLTPESFPRLDSLRVVRVTLADGTRLKLKDAQITPDSLRGMDIRAERPLIVPLTDIEGAQTRHFDAGKTVGLVLGLGVAAGVAFFIALAKSFEGY